MKLYKEGIVVLLIAALLFVTACSGNNSKGGNNEPSEKPQSSAPSTEGAASDPFGKYDEPVTLNIAYYTPPNVAWPAGEESDTLENNRFTRLIEEKLNIKFKHAFEVPQTGYEEKMNLLISSNDLPDFFTVTEKQFKILAESDVLEDMSQVYADYASPLLKEVISGFGEDFIKKAMYDGKLLGIPSTVPAHDNDGVVWIRTDWLDSVGIKLDEVITLEQLEQVARAFIEQDPDKNNEKDTYGLQSNSNFVTSSVGPNSLDLIFTAHKAFPKTWIKDTSGKIVYGSIVPETKAALEKLQQLYADGLLDKEFGTVKIDQFAKDVSAGKAGIVMGNTWAPMSALADSVKNDPTAKWSGYVLIAADGKYYARQPNPLGHIMVAKKGVKHVEAFLKAINLTAEGDNNTGMFPDVYADSPGTNWTIRPIQKTFRKMNTVRDRFQLFQDAASGKVKPEDITSKDKPIYENYLKGYEELKKTPQDWAYVLYQYKGGKTVLNPVNTKVYNEFYGLTDAMELKWANLTKLENEAFIRIIVGNQPIDYFETFVSEWKKQGGNEITQEVERELSR